MHSTYSSPALQPILERLHQLEVEVNELRRRVHPLHVSDKEAVSQVESYIQRQQSGGKTKLSLLDISLDLQLPIDQVDRVMETLKQKGIREVE